MHELQLAKSEGVHIPEDLEKRLERFQDQDMEDGKKSGKGKGNAKVVPMGRRGTSEGQLTRYAP